jgi:hypothetical protein
LQQDALKHRESAVRPDRTFTLKIDAVDSCETSVPADQQDRNFILEMEAASSFEASVIT